MVQHTHTTLCKNSGNALWLTVTSWVGIWHESPCRSAEFQHPNSCPPLCGRDTMGYRAVLNSTTFEVLFRTARWATVDACHSSHNKLCYVTVTPGQPRDVSHQRRPIRAHINSAKLSFFLLLKNCIGRTTKTTPWSRMLYNADNVFF